jgi:hypothetical protein
VTISVLDINDAPVLAQQQNLYVYEDHGLDYSIYNVHLDKTFPVYSGNISATDQDVGAGDFIRYPMLQVMDNFASSWFSLNAQNGQLFSLQNSSGKIDFETKSYYSVVVGVNDSYGSTDNITTKIIVRDVNEIPQWCCLGKYVNRSGVLTWTNAGCVSAQYAMLENADAVGDANKQSELRQIGPYFGSRPTAGCAARQCPLSCTGANACWKDDICFHDAGAR